MATCANPECPDDMGWDSSRWTSWVQVEQTMLVTDGHNGSHVVQKNLAAVTCSKRCAIAVLSRDLEVEESRRAKFNPFASAVRSSQSSSQIPE